MKKSKQKTDSLPSPENESVEIDKNIMIPGITILLILSFSFFFIDVSGSQRISDISRFLTSHLGSIYLIYIFGVLILLIGLAVSKIGSIRLGEGPPQYTTPNWISMLFCACIGSSILYWGLIEWAFYTQSPPFGMAPMSMEAAEWSVAYTMFHWGFSGWAAYCLAAIIIAYFFFVKKIPIFRISVSCGLLNCSRKKAFLGRIIDIFVIIGLCSGIAVGVAIGAPMLAQGLYELFGIVPSTKVNIIIAIVWSLLFSLATLRGIDKGVKVLSNINSIIAMGFILYVLLCGNTNFIINNTTNSLGIMLQNFIRMSFSTDPISHSWFPQDWTVFYWAWWLSYVPVMGLFIAKISRGRTIRQVIFGTTVLGSVGCWFFQSVLGGYALDMQLSGKFDLLTMLNNQGDYPAIMGLLKTLPMPMAVIAVFIILSFIFMATTCDSSAYILATLSSKELTIYQEPSKLSRLIWCLASIIWPIILLLVGGINVVKLCSIIGSIPLIFIIAVMVKNFLSHVRKRPEI